MWFPLRFGATARDLPQMHTQIIVDSISWEKDANTSITLLTHTHPAVITPASVSFGLGHDVISD